MKEHVAALRWHKFEVVLIINGYFVAPLRFWTNIKADRPETFSRCYFMGPFSIVLSSISTFSSDKFPFILFINLMDNVFGMFLKERSGALVNMEHAVVF